MSLSPEDTTFPDHRSRNHACGTDAEFGSMESPASFGLLGDIDMVDHGCPVAGDHITGAGAVAAPFTLTLPDIDNKGGETVLVLTPGDVPAATKLVKPWTGPCVTITGEWDDPEATTYTIGPDREEPHATGTAFVLVPGGKKQGSGHISPCNECVTLTKVVEDCPTPVTITMLPTGTNTATTVIILDPTDVPGFTTVTRPLPSGSEAITVTLAPDAPGDTITVIVSEPTDAGLTTITRSLTSGTEAITVTQAPDTPGGRTTVIISEPNPGSPGTTTITRPSGSGDDLSTVTLVPDSPEDTVTVVVPGPTDPNLTTITRPLPDGTQTVTITRTPDEPDGTTTVIIGDPDVTTTITGPQISDGVTTTPMTEEMPMETVTIPSPTFVFTPSPVESPPPAETPGGGDGDDPGDDGGETPGDGGGQPPGEGDETPTPDPTPEPVPSVPDQDCNNVGVDYAIQRHLFSNNDPPAFSSFDPTFFARNRPVFIGTTDRIGIQALGPYFVPFSIYADTPPRQMEFTAVNHQGYLYAPVTGDYSISIPSSDDITFVWVGSDAFQGWNRANADVEQNYAGNGIEAIIPLTAGTFTPFRVLWANAQTDYNFNFEVRDPDGRIVVNRDGIGSEILVRFACDGSTPAFPAWGDENLVDDDDFVTVA